MKSNQLQLALSDQDLREYFLIVGGFAFFEAAYSAMKIGVIDFIASAPKGRRVSEIRRKFGMSENAAETLVSTLASLRLIKRRSKEGVIQLTPMSRLFLCGNSPYSKAVIFEDHHSIQYRAMHHLSAALLSGKNAGLVELPGAGRTIYAKLSQTLRLEKIFHERLELASKSTLSLLERVPVFENVTRLLDIGGGSGTTAIGLARRYPQLKITIMDGKSVCRLARKKIANAGLSSRIRTLEGNCFTDPIPRGFDAVYMGHFNNIYSPERNRKLFKKIARALPKRGQIFLLDDMAPDDGSGSLGTSMLSLYFQTLATGEGRCYSALELRTWLKEAGFNVSKTFEIKPWDGKLVYARI